MGDETCNEMMEQFAVVSTRFSAKSLTTSLCVTPMMLQAMLNVEMCSSRCREPLPLKLGNFVLDLDGKS